MLFETVDLKEVSALTWKILWSPYLLFHLPSIIASSSPHPQSYSSTCGTWSRPFDKSDSTPWTRWLNWTWCQRKTFYAPSTRNSTRGFLQSVGSTRTTASTSCSVGSCIPTIRKKKREHRVVLDCVYICDLLEERGRKDAVGQRGGRSFQLLTQRPLRIRQDWHPLFRASGQVLRLDNDAAFTHCSPLTALLPHQSSLFLRPTAIVCGRMLCGGSRSASAQALSICARRWRKTCRLKS